MMIGDRVLRNIVKKKVLDVRKINGGVKEFHFLMRERQPHIRQVNKATQVHGPYVFRQLFVITFLPPLSIVRILRKDLLSPVRFLLINSSIRVFDLLTHPMSLDFKCLSYTLSPAECFFSFHWSIDDPCEQFSLKQQCI